MYKGCDTYVVVVAVALGVVLVLAVFRETIWFFFSLLVLLDFLVGEGFFSPLSILFFFFFPFFLV